MQVSIDIAWWQLALFMLVLLVPMTINHYLRLGLNKQIVISVARMTSQLILVGLYLEFLFKLQSPLFNLAWLLLMVLIGASAIITGAKLPRRKLFVPILTALVVAVTPLLAILLLALLRPSPLYSAQYLIPIAGMLLGNSLSANIIALQRLFNALEERKEQYEAVLALGGSPMQAAFPFVQTALQQSLAPILATMTTTGLVTLPGMMTGQILGGTNPMIAIKYQLVILVAIFVMLSISVSIALLLSVRMGIQSTGLVTIRTKQN